MTLVVFCGFTVYMAIIVVVQLVYVGLAQARPNYTLGIQIKKIIARIIMFAGEREGLGIGTRLRI